jgi:hypothetical protein
VEDEVLRRHLLALGAVSGFGVQIPGIGVLADPYPAPDELPLPSGVPSAPLRAAGDNPRPAVLTSQLYANSAQAYARITTTSRL